MSGSSGSMLAQCNNPDSSDLSIMRKILVFAILLTALAFGIDALDRKDDMPDMERRLMERLNVAPLAEYKDRDFGFVARYPDIFVKNNDTTGRYFGCSRFDFWQLTIECYVVYDRKERGFKEYMDSIASAAGATALWCRRRFMRTGCSSTDSVIMQNMSRAIMYGLSMRCIIRRHTASRSAVCSVL